MKKRAITYYKDVLKGVSYIDIHESGVSAVKYFKENAKSFFNTPINWKSSDKITEDKMLSVIIGMRGYYCRFLSKEENGIY